MSRKIELDPIWKVYSICYASITLHLRTKCVRFRIVTIKPRILVIEDQPEVLNLIVLVLIRAGFDVTAAENGSDGMDLAKTQRFDLITTDVDLPEMDGFEICSRLKKDPQLCHTPVVFVSGRFAEEDVQRGRELGAADYITKPFELSSFVSRILIHTASLPAGSHAH